EGRHVRWHVLLRIAIRPQDQLAVGVERDVGSDLLDAAHDPALDEVAHGPGFGSRERVCAAVLDALAAARRPAAAAEPVAVVAVEVGADARTGVRLPILPPRAEGIPGQVV